MTTIRHLMLLAGAALLTSSLMTPDSIAWAAQDEGDDEQPGWFSTIQWRCIGPSRGGRVQAVAGIPGDRMTYYMGATGGGVWKTTDAGESWDNISDEHFQTGSVGAIAVAESDPNVIYVGMGETCLRGNHSHGDGVYKSMDAGRTWEHVGLEDTRAIGAIEVHPDDPDHVYVAALGHPYGPNEQRGVFESTDGGETWARIHFVDENTGAVDLKMDPSNPRIMYAAFWQVKRTPWSLESGGEGSGIYKTTDGGESWAELTRGLPRGIMGKIGIDVSPVDPDVVWAIVEAEDGGVFRSGNGGESFRRTNDDRSLRQRAWYYTHITADTQDVDTVYVMNVGFHKSTDGGENFDERIRVPHVDNHAFWIDPNDNQRMVNGNDGGANVSFDGGETWSTQTNQPTAQFYHVITDDQFPYRVYGAQQDNSTMSLSSQNRLGGWERDWYSVGGGESGYIAPVPGNPDLVYAGSYGGYLTLYNHDTDMSRNIMVWPENPMGWGAAELNYRFQWTFPIVISPHNPNRVYVGGNVLFVSENGGQSWTPISGDLTTNDKSKQQSSGGPITKDNTSVEYYCTIFTVAESPLEEGLIWAGSDDGLIHVTSDGGRNWTNVTPEGMGDWPLISLIEASPHDPDTAYAAVNRYKMDDFAPYIYKTEDRGQTWELIVNGIDDDDAFVRAVREDPVREGLLYAGTETGAWISFNDGANWQSLQHNLPVVPITDLVVKDEDLVLATQGRSFWTLEDLAPLRQYDESLERSVVHVLDPGPTYRAAGDDVRLHYYFSDEPEGEVTLEVLDREGEVIKTFTGSAAAEDDEEDEESDDDRGRRGRWRGFDGQDDDLPVSAGMNLFTWNMRYPDAEEVEDAVMWGGSTRGPQAAPGSYTTRLTVSGDTIEKPFDILADPRVATTQQQYDEQFDMLWSIRNAVNDAHVSINRIRTVRTQVDAAFDHARKAGKEGAIESAARELKAQLTAIEEQLMQVKSESRQDPLNFPIMLNNKLAALASSIDTEFPITEQTRAVFNELKGELDKLLGDLQPVMTTEVEKFNQIVRQQDIPAVVTDTDTDTDDE